MQRVDHTVNLPASAAGAAALAVLPDLRDATPLGFVWLQFVGVFTATYILEASVDGNTWYDAKEQLYDVDAAAALAVGVSAVALLRFTGNPPRLRLKCTAYTSSDATAQLLVSAMR